MKRREFIILVGGAAAWPPVALTQEGAVQVIGYLDQAPSEDESSWSPRGKGGVGKTTSTAALGAALAQTGQKVAVIDFDVGLRNLDLQCMRNGLAYSVGRDYTEIMAPGNGPRET